ncbi:MAG: hypothetical protein JJT88_00435 [Gammaproteobacteria bacterium]|nr:hypothetical protein [Gammaproteobacteria bacterium]
MISRAFLLLTTASMLALSIPAFSECNPDFGDKALDWVNREAGTQSRNLAEVDYAARSFSERFVGYEKLHLDVAQLEQELSAIAREIATLDASSRTDVGLAIQREQMSERLLTRLHALAAAIESLRQRNSQFRNPTDDAEFARLGLGAVGRETLLASMFDSGRLSEPTLGGRYSVSVRVVFDEDGSPQSGHLFTDPGGAESEAMASTVGYALTKTGHPYAVVAGTLLIGGALVISDNKCNRRWDEQRERLQEAGRILPSKLITEKEQWVLVDRFESAEIARFAPHGTSAEGAIDGLAERWRTLFAANAARAAASDAVLTVAKINQIRRDLANGIDPADIRKQVAISEVAADVARVNNAVALGRIPVITGCLSTVGVVAEEDQLDGVRFARAQFNALRTQGGFAPLYDLLDQSDAYAAAAESEVATSGPSATGRSCPSGQSPSFPQAFPNGVQKSVQVADAPVLATVKTSREDLVPVMLNPAEGATQPFTSRQRAVAPLGALSAELRAGRFDTSFCVAVKTGQFYGCGRPGIGQTYGSEFRDTGRPRFDVFGGANDGGFANDSRRSSSKIDEASQNIWLRIRTTRERVAEARRSAPGWFAHNTAALDEMTTRARKADSADLVNELAFRTATAPLLTRTASALEAFRTGAADPAAVAELVRAVGGADMSLPELARTSLPNTVPPIRGITAIEANFVTGSSATERAIQRELWKAEEALGDDKDALDLSRDLLAEARFAAKATSGAGNQIIDELILDSASLRFTASGKLNGTIAVVEPDGSIVRAALADPRLVPENALFNMVRAFRHDQDFFRAAVAQLEGDLASGGAFAGRRGDVLEVAHSLFGQAGASFSAGEIAEAQAWLSMAIGAVDIATRFIPGVNWGRDVYEAVLGRDLFTGEELDTLDRVGAIIGVLSAGVGSNALSVSRVLRRIEDLPLRRKNEIYEFAQTVDRSTHASLRYRPYARDRMVQRRITEEEILEVLDNHTPLWSVRHRSYTAVGHVSTRPERVAVAVRVDRREIRTVFVEGLDDVPLERLRFADGPHRGKPQYRPIRLDN